MKTYNFKIVGFQVQQRLFIINDLLQEDENENDYSFEDFELAMEEELEALEYKLQEENMNTKEFNITM